jgi:nucleoside-diphosphate-sugar epimerase
MRFGNSKPRESPASSISSELVDSHLPPAWILSAALLVEIMSAPRVLLLGGHGKVSLYLTPLLLAKSWNVTSVIRDPKQQDEILALGKGQKGQVDVLIESLDDMKSDADAQKVLDKVKPDYVVWSAGERAAPGCTTNANRDAGAGGKGGPQRTYAVDRDAAKHYISSSLATPTISKFLMISYIGSRRNKAPWWNDEDWKATQHVNTEVLPHYYKAKVEADEHLAALTKKRRDNGDLKFQAINLRPGLLTDPEPTGKVKMGQTPARGNIPRADVAAVAVALLERSDTNGWYDVLEGPDEIVAAIDQLVKDKHDGIAGEDLQRIYSKAT